LAFVVNALVFRGVEDQSGVNVATFRKSDISIYEERPSVNLRFANALSTKNVRQAAKSGLSVCQPVDRAASQGIMARWTKA
jgi:hypothetical protein